MREKYVVEEGEIIIIKKIVVVRRVAPRRTKTSGCRTLTGKRNSFPSCTDFAPAGFWTYRLYSSQFFGHIWFWF
jgi:hypothetical protein